MKKGTVGKLTVRNSPCGRPQTSVARHWWWTMQAALPQTPCITGGVGTATVVAASSRRGTQLFFPFFFDSNNIFLTLAI